MTAPLLIIGAGGLSRETLAAVEAVNSVRPQWTVLGFLDDNPALHGQIIDGRPVLGPTGLVAEQPDAAVVLTIASPRNLGTRKKIVHRLDLPAHRWATVVHPTASIAPGTELGAGSVFLAATVVTAPQVIGAHVVAMPHTTITHDDNISDYVQFASGVRLSGGVTVGESAYLGSGSMVREGLTIGAGALLGMGAVVLSDVPPGEVWVGNPARRLRTTNSVDQIPTRTPA
ncbi:MAG TPA: acetyltransferase [Actinophytocola sp.]|uniref:acetyltransferase n=1 Tax=Actinophytocola sp. TaxID=1872138 RepID=UPI002DB57B66|nr:acetyltransferase [Actinophytocola sp.]HEU5471771.1 acetyltransferase [Actinophytocola sp.]